MPLRPRDSQRSRVYAWERVAVATLPGRNLYEAEFNKIDECDEWARPIWRKERGRVGLAGTKAPSIESSSWGQRRALAHHDHRITLPRWARSRWVILHEMAHRLTPRDEAHGPRFVGVLIGLACRWLDYDAETLMRLADEKGVRYHVRSVGKVPVHGPAWHVRQVLSTSKSPRDLMDIACELSIGCGVDITYKQVRGAALHLVARGEAVWRRRLLAMAPSAIS
jgi:putative metallohydrolase (TIGR04338 family)